MLERVIGLELMQRYLLGSNNKTEMMGDKLRGKHDVAIELEWRPRNEPGEGQCTLNG